MLFEDTFKTIKNQSEGIFKDRGSRFIALAFPVTSEEEVKKNLDALRKKYHDARHHCFAYRLGYDKLNFRTNDDGEPSGTAGKPIFNQILSHDLTNILVVVVRYFGGIKLGVSGLINAYKTATLEAFSNAEIIKKTVNDLYELRFDYLLMNSVMKVIKEENLKQVSHAFENDCMVILSIRKNDSERVYNKISTIKDVTIRFVGIQY